MEPNFNSVNKKNIQTIQLDIKENQENQAIKEDGNRIKKGKALRLRRKSTDYSSQIFFTNQKNLESRPLKNITIKKPAKINEKETLWLNLSATTNIELSKNNSDSNIPRRKVEFSRSPRKSPFTHKKISPREFWECLDKEDPELRQKSVRDYVNQIFDAFRQEHNDNLLGPYDFFDIEEKKFIFFTKFKKCFKKKINDEIKKNFSLSATKHKHSKEKLENIDIKLNTSALNKIINSQQKNNKKIFVLNESQINDLIQINDYHFTDENNKSYYLNIKSLCKDYYFHDEEIIDTKIDTNTIKEKHIKSYTNRLDKLLSYHFLHLNKIGLFLDGIMATDNKREGLEYLPTWNDVKKLCLKVIKEEKDPSIILFPKHGEANSRLELFLKCISKIKEDKKWSMFFDEVMGGAKRSELTLKLLKSKINQRNKFKKILKQTHTIQERKEIQASIIKISPEQIFMTHTRGQPLDNEGGFAFGLIRVFYLKFKDDSIDIYFKQNNPNHKHYLGNWYLNLILALKNKNFGNIETKLDFGDEVIKYDEIRNFGAPSIESIVTRDLTEEEVITRKLRQLYNYKINEANYDDWVKLYNFIFNKKISWIFILQCLSNSAASSAYYAFKNIYGFLFNKDSLKTELCKKTKNVGAVKVLSKDGAKMYHRKCYVSSLVVHLKHSSGINNEIEIPIANIWSEACISITSDIKDSCSLYFTHLRISNIEFFEVKKRYKKFADKIKFFQESILNELKNIEKKKGEIITLENQAHVTIMEKIKPSIGIKKESFTSILASSSSLELSDHSCQKSSEFVIQIN